MLHPPLLSISSALSRAIFLGIAVMAAFPQARPEQPRGLSRVGCFHHPVPPSVILSRSEESASDPTRDSSLRLRMTGAPTILRCPLCSFCVYSRGDPRGRPANNSQAPQARQQMTCITLLSLLKCAYNFLSRYSVNAHELEKRAACQEQGNHDKGAGILF